MAQFHGGSHSWHFLKRGWFKEPAFFMPSAPTGGRNPRPVSRRVTCLRMCQKKPREQPWRSGTGSGETGSSGCRAERHEQQVDNPGPPPRAPRTSLSDSLVICGVWRPAGSQEQTAKIPDHRIPTRDSLLKF